jgi:hypothetical protein
VHVVAQAARFIVENMPRFAIGVSVEQRAAGVSARRSAPDANRPF